LLVCQDRLRIENRSRFVSIRPHAGREADQSVTNHREYLPNGVSFADALNELALSSSFSFRNF
ncbi:hypothetical protein, partial [Rhizobium brockwellii]|uniref:hypothetical protein n=1 Tax=Rhizobium brockwellii TaxID=3019932 RepID=UPI003F9A21BF